MNFKTILLKSIIKLIPQKLYYKILKVHFFRKLKTYYKNDEFEKLEPDLDIIKLLIKPMDSVIDVGANFGFYTFYLSQLVGKYGHVYSMEPIPLTFEMLSYITRKLSLDNVSTFNYGISERNGSAIMEIPKFELGNDNFYEARITRNKNPDLKYFKVNLRSLDSLLFNKTNKITFIKIDVEGHELQVINDAAKLINSYKPAF